jgi:hypothetical protein
MLNNLEWQVRPPGKHVVHRTTGVTGPLWVVSNFTTVVSNFSTVDHMPILLCLQISMVMAEITTVGAPKPLEIDASEVTQRLLRLFSGQVGLVRGVTVAGNLSGQVGLVRGVTFCGQV